MVYWAIAGMITQRFGCLSRVVSRADPAVPDSADYAAMVT